MHKTITLTLAEDYVTLTRGSARQRVSTDMLRAARNPDAILSQMLDRVTFDDALNRLEQAVFALDDTAHIEIQGSSATVYQHDKPTHTFDLTDPNVDYAEALAHRAIKTDLLNEILRLREQIAQHEAALEAIGAGGVSGERIRQRRGA